MTVEPAPDGWYVEHNRRYYHLNMTWLAEWSRHQLRGTINPAFNRVVSGWDQLAATDILELFPQIIGGTRAGKPVRQATPTDFQTWVTKTRHR